LLFWEEGKEECVCLIEWFTKARVFLILISLFLISFLIGYDFTVMTAKPYKPVIIETSENANQNYESTEEVTFDNNNTVIDTSGNTEIVNNAGD